MGVLTPDGTPYISGVDPQPNVKRDAHAALRRMAGKESGCAKRRRKAIERREFWNKKESNE